MCRAAVLIHLYYTDLWPEFSHYLKNFKDIPFGLYINITVDRWNTELHELIIKEYPKAQITISKNAGKDILGLLNLIQNADLNKYDAVAYLHTKKSPTQQLGSQWRKKLIESIIGSTEIISKNIDTISNKNIGMIGSEEFTENGIGDNQYYYKRYSQLLGCETNKELKFIAGNMFWIKSDLLKKIKFSQIPLDDFGISNLKDGGPEHGFERAIANLTLSMGYQIND